MFVEFCCQLTDEYKLYSSTYIEILLVFGRQILLIFL
jgi:hypothetical protein